MTDIKRGDYIRQTTEGKVSEVYDDEVIFYTAKGQRRYAILSEVVKVDPPVKVGDVISYEKALTLPYNSVVFGMESHSPYQVGVNTLWHGVVRMTELGGHQQRQEYEVLKIMREK